MIVGIEKGVPFDGYDVKIGPSENELELLRKTEDIVVVNGTLSEKIDFRVGSADWDANDELVDMRFESVDVRLHKGQQLDEVLKTIKVNKRTSDYFVPPSDLFGGGSHV